MLSYDGVGDNIMRQTASLLAAATIIAAFCWATLAAFLPRGLKAHGFDMPAFAPIETIVDLLEAAYGGPIGRDEAR
jgi:hypothetical protein